MLWKNMKVKKKYPKKKNEKDKKKKYRESVLSWKGLTLGPMLWSGILVLAWVVDDSHVRVPWMCTSQDRSHFIVNYLYSITYFVMYGLHRDILLSMLVHVLWRTSSGIMSNNVYNLTHEIDSMFVFFKT